MPKTSRGIGLNAGYPHTRGPSGRLLSIVEREPYPGVLATVNALPTIFTVLRKLGLELKQQEATVPVYTVKHIERLASE